MGKRSSEEAIKGVEQDYLRMPYNKYLWLRLEFMILCGDQLEAFLMRVVEYEIEGDRLIWLKKATDRAQNGLSIPNEPDEWWVALSYKQIMMRLYGAVKNEKTIIAKLTSLLKKQFLLRRTNPDNPYGAPQYTINRKLVQDKLDNLPALPSMKEVAKRHETKPSNPVPPTGTPSNEEESKDQYQEMVPPVPPTGTPSTTSYDSPVPGDGTAPYQEMVHSYKDNNNDNNLEETEECDDASASPAHHLLPAKNQNEVETHPASYRPNEGPNERSNNNPLAHSIPATPPAHSGMSAEQCIEGDTLHPHLHQSGVEGAQQAIIPTSGEMPQAQQLGLLEQQATAETSIQATKAGRKGSAKGNVNDAPATGVGGKTGEVKKRPAKPVMPPAEMEWCAEKAVQIVEFKIGKYYSDISRPDQLKAGEKIVKRKVTEEQFTNAYDKRNDAWWRSRKGLLHVIHMAAKTDRGQMRVVEVLGELDGFVQAADDGKLEKQAEPSLRPSVLVSEEKAQQNLEAAKARVAARRAAASQATPPMMQTQMAL